MKFTKLMFVSLFAFTASTGIVHAEAISSQSVMQAQHSIYNKQQLIQIISREDMQTRLTEMGVQRSDAIARINAMTDAEVEQLNQQLNDAPAGGIVGAVITILAFLAITDLLGVTDVYPFISPINS